MTTENITNTLYEIMDFEDYKINGEDGEICDLEKVKIAIPKNGNITSENLDITIKTAIPELEAGNHLIFPLQGDIECTSLLVSELLDYQEQILFVVSIPSLEHSDIWLLEPDAPCPCERLESLKLLYETGYRTSVKSAPFFKNSIIEVHEKVSQYITDEHWIGITEFDFNILKDEKLSDAFLMMMERIKELQDDESIIDLYLLLDDEPQIMWHNSILDIIDDYGILEDSIQEVRNN
jgi:hypothetical protein